MATPFLFRVGERLTLAELTAARLDGVLVEVGEAYMPADAVETRELRAASLRGLFPIEVAFTHASAAWIHGVGSQPPHLLEVQRAVPKRINAVMDARARYRDIALAPEHVDLVAGVKVTTLARTVADLARAGCGGDTASLGIAAALLAQHPSLGQRASALLRDSPPVHFKRPALAWLAARAETAQDYASQNYASQNYEEVTR